MATKLKETKLTKTQAEHLATAVAHETAVKQELNRAEQERAKTVLLILDAHNAPTDSSISLDKGVVIHTPATAAPKNGKGKTPDAAPPKE